MFTQSPESLRVTINIVGLCCTVITVLRVFVVSLLTNSRRVSARSLCADLAETAGWQTCLSINTDIWILSDALLLSHFPLNQSGDIVNLAPRNKVVKY